MLMGVFKGLLKQRSALLIKSLSRLFMRYTSCSLSEGYIGCLDKSFSSRAEGKGQIALYIVAKSILSGCPNFTPPTL